MFYARQKPLCCQWLEHRFNKRPFSIQAASDATPARARALARNTSIPMPVSVRAAPA